jgi:hypothetical protein
LVGKKVVSFGKPILVEPATVAIQIQKVVKGHESILLDLCMAELFLLPSGFPYKKETKKACLKRFGELICKGGCTVV